MNKYTPVIGLEIHVELKTNSKMFCSCPANWFGKTPNTVTCPICLGMPGMLPVPNKMAVEWAIKIGKALGCTIAIHSKFDRKNYFYPDLPKGYQISQYDEPFGQNGIVTFSQKSKSGTIEKKQVLITRVHMEEDTGKLIHKDNETLVDFNRSGVPLVEIVTEPVFDNSDDVKRFLEELHTIIRSLGASDCDMEKGSMRLEPNISVTTKKGTLPNYKVEVKNINSFRYVKQAIDYEVKRHIELFEKGETPAQETRGYNEKKQVTFSQRTKEQAHDYRYFPDPDIPPMVFEQTSIDGLSLPEMPEAKLQRFMNDFGIKYDDAFILTRDANLSDYFELVVSKVATQSKIENMESRVASIIVNKKISVELSHDEFVAQAIQSLAPKHTDEKKLQEEIEKVIRDNPKPVEEYKKGKSATIMFLVGMVMRQMKGEADATVVKKQLERKLID